ncbi:37S ribosomal protein S24, mitochondrial [Pleosporales sp. CAS-2024a]
MSSTPPRRLDDDTKPTSAAAPSAHDAAPTDSAPVVDEDMARQLARLASDLRALNPEVVAELQRKGERGMPFATDFNLEKPEHFEMEEDDPRKVAAGFWAEGEPEMGPDEEYFGDDLTTLGHAKLQQHRMLREYARLIAWELPLLNPTPFRFRYTSYVNEKHPAANKVVVEFDPSDLSLAAPCVAKLIKLAGPRFNPSTNMIKLSCEKFDTQTQNKRFLGDTIAGLIKEAQDLTDSFDDVPFDFRHHKVKKKVLFPDEWVMTAERKKYLEDKRRETAALEDQRLHNGQMVDGKTIIETSLPFFNESADAEAVPAGARLLK